MSSKVDQVQLIAQSIGFEFTGAALAADLVVKPEVREMCAADKCQHYNKSWVCPPACGNLEYYQDIIGQHSVAVLVQSIGKMEDSFDLDAIFDTAELQDERFARFIDRVNEELAGADPRPFFLGSGTCTICPKCAYPEPCRFPEKQYVSMESAGLVVSEVCVAANVPYNHGNDAITYTGCVLL